MALSGNDTLSVRRTLTAGGREFDFFSLRAAEEAGVGQISRLPYSMKVLLENLLRYEDGRSVTIEDVKAAANWDGNPNNNEIAFRPARVLLQDLTGVPAVVDLAAMREAMEELGGDPQKINPLSAVDLVIDHSVMVDNFGDTGSFEKNVEIEFQRNTERYEFLRWGSTAFRNFRVVPPGTGICHQVNLEYLAQVIWSGVDDNGRRMAYPDTLVGTDSHTTMVNGLAVLGWGCGGIEAEAGMLGQPISMLLPEVIGFKLTGELREGTTATDLVLTVTQMLRAKGVVSKFVEFFGPGLDNLSLPDRATIGNMAPEYGATCGFFPIDKETVRYLRLSGRDESLIELVETYARAQGMWREAGSPDPIFTDTMELDISTVEPSLAGPRRPQDRVLLSEMSQSFKEALPSWEASKGPTKVEGMDHELSDGDVVIAAITSCTNTSNPSVLVAAGLLARNAVARGLAKKPWVKTSLAPGSQVVTDYLAAAGLQDDLDALGFNLVGYGCTTCIGNSGPLPSEVGDAIDGGDLVVGAVLSGNRNFEGRVHQQVKANYLASPPLCVAYALAGSLTFDLTNDPLGHDDRGNAIYLRDIWPSNEEIQQTIAKAVTPEQFRSRYGNVQEGPKAWRTMKVPEGEIYEWNEGSTYVRYPSYLKNVPAEPNAISDIIGARPLLILGDSVTTDHISPAGGFGRAVPAAEYLLERQIRPEEFNSYGARRGNHEVMMRGTFANIRIRNEIVPGIEGGYTKHMPDGEEMSVFDASMRYQEENVPLVVFGGKDYGMGSSRDWAAKGPNLLGIKAAIVESFERIHRSNLIGMGVLPLVFKEGENRKSLNLNEDVTIDIVGIAEGITPGMDVKCLVHRPDGSNTEFTAKCRIDTLDEVEYYRHGGILHYVLRNIRDQAA